MRIVRIDQETLRRIRSRYASPFFIRLMATLSEGGKPFAELWEDAGGNAASVLPEIRKIGQKGLIERSNTIYSLTAQGRLYADAVVAFIRAVDALNQNEILEIGGRRVDAGQDQPGYPLLDLYENNRTDIHLLLNSDILIPVLLSLETGEKSSAHLAARGGFTTGAIVAGLAELEQMGAVSRVQKSWRLEPPGGMIVASLKTMISVMDGNPHRETV